MTTLDRIGILIADDNHCLRMAIASLLQPEGDIDILGEAADGVEAVERTMELLPKVVVMDITMPRMDGFEATLLLRTKMPAARVVILTQHDNINYVQRARAVGACGYLMKHEMYGKLAAIIRRVANGEMVFDFPEN